MALYEVGTDKECNKRFTTKVIFVQFTLLNLFCTQFVVVNFWCHDMSRIIHILKRYITQLYTSMEIWLLWQRILLYLYYENQLSARMLAYTYFYKICLKYTNIYVHHTYVCLCIDFENELTTAQKAELSPSDWAERPVNLADPSMQSSIFLSISP